MGASSSKQPSPESGDGRAPAPTPAPDRPSPPLPSAALQLVAAALNTFPEHPSPSPAAAATTAAAGSRQGLVAPAAPAASASSGGVRPAVASRESLPLALPPFRTPLALPPSTTASSASLSSLATSTSTYATSVSAPVQHPRVHTQHAHAAGAAEPRAHGQQQQPGRAPHTAASSSAPRSASRPAVAAALPAPVRLDATIPLQSSVLGFTEVHVRVATLAAVAPEHASWLCSGWGAKHPKVLGVDTEFVGHELALLQLACGSRVLVVQVPKARRLLGQQQPAAAGAAARRAASPHKCPAPLAALLCDPAFPKAAAEVWQDALVLFTGFGTKLRNGLDLTVACPPTEEEQKRGRKKLPLFEIFSRFFPSSELKKDKTINHRRWHDKSLSQAQIKYAALDAFVSYAAGVSVVTRPQKCPLPIDLSKPPHWEVLAAAQWVAVGQWLQANEPDRTQHDFLHATFKETKKREVILEVRMARFKTRMRRGFWVDMHTPEGQQLSGKCIFAAGKTARVGQLKWRGAEGKDVKLAEVTNVHLIEMSEGGADSFEEEGMKSLITEVLTGQRSMQNTSYLAAALFSGAPTAARAQPGMTIPTRVAVQAGLTSLHADGRVNSPQRDAVSAVLLGVEPVQLVQGPPGTGKTTVISRSVAMWLSCVAPHAPRIGAERALEVLACVARSNVAARNMALALIKLGLGPNEFRLVVSHEFHFEWHEEQYKGALEAVLITSDMFEEKDLQRRVEGVQVVVTTVSMLASPRFREAMLYRKRLTRLMVDEASQIYAGDLLLPLAQYGAHLRTLSLFGDDMQLPPYGSEWNGAQIPSTFDFSGKHPQSVAAQLLARQPSAFGVGPAFLTPAAGVVKRVMLAVSYRLPRHLCSFISGAMYGGQLESGRAVDARSAVRWVDVRGKEETRGGTSMCNETEAAAVGRLVKQGFGGSSWTVLTGYDKQRWLLSKELSRLGVAGNDASDRVYNIDTFQGREDEVVVVSLVRSGKSLGFMRDDRRVNVMLTRCTQQLVVVGNLGLALQHPSTLIGRMAVHCAAAGRVEVPEGAASPSAQPSGAAAAAATWRQQRQ